MLKNYVINQMLYTANRQCGGVVSKALAEQWVMGLRHNGEESDKDTNMQCNAMESKSTEFVGWPSCPLTSVISFEAYHLKYICRDGSSNTLLFMQTNILQSN